MARHETEIHRERRLLRLVVSEQRDALESVFEALEFIHAEMHADPLFDAHAAIGALIEMGRPVRVCPGGRGIVRIVEGAT